jgi:hypothetical protein
VLVDPGAHLVDGGQDYGGVRSPEGVEGIGGQLLQESDPDVGGILVSEQCKRFLFGER